MWVSGPASEIAKVHGREIGLLEWYDVNPAMNSSEIDAVGAGSAGDDGMGQLVDQREPGDRPGQPPAELATVVEERQEHHEDDEPGADMDREAEQPEQRLCTGSGHAHLSVCPHRPIDFAVVPYVYAFDHKHRRPPMEMKDLLGGKGANLAEMTSVLKLPVPGGFTISTDACRAYLASGWPKELDAEIAKQVSRPREEDGSPPR